MKNEASDLIAEDIMGMLDRPMMYVQGGSTESLELALLTAMQCWLYTQGTNRGRVHDLWHEELRRLHGNTGAKVVLLSDRPEGGKAMHMDAVTVPMRRMWLRLSDPVTSVGSIAP